MKILVAGDFCQRDRVNDAIIKHKFGELFDDVKSIIESADYSIVNFEFPIVINAGDAKPIKKCGPNLRGTIEAVEAIKYAGFKCCTLANNHILDQGEKCCFNTKTELENVGIDTVGVGANLDEASKILYKEFDNKKLAIINCCEHEFSIATETEAGANPLNPIHQFYAIQEAKKNADYVLVIVHGGHEHFQLPSPRMQETYRFFVDAGADAVVNHHQHCYSGYEVYKNKPIFYGLGNFCFDITTNNIGETWNLGYMVELTFEENIKFKLYPYKQYGQSPTIELLENNAFDSKLKELNAIIADPVALRKCVSDYYSKCSKQERMVLEPYSGRIMSKLFRMRMLPRFIKGKKLSAIMNHVYCEAHRDKLVYALKQKNK